MSFLSSLFGRGAASDEVRPDAAASLAAARVLALAGSGPDWWPYAALVTRRLLAVHVAGAAAPSPAAPWRAAPDPRLWTISRAAAQSMLEGGQAVADLLEAATVPRPILLGRYPDGFVYLDVARAPGPLAVRGEEPWAGWVRELLIAQLPDAAQVLDGAAAVSGAHWPVEVSERGTISVLGAAMAFGIKSPERLDLPIAPSRRTVLRELAAGTRQQAAPEDEVAAPLKTGTRRETAPAPVPASTAAPAPALKSTSKQAPQPAPGPKPAAAPPPASKTPLRQQPAPAPSAPSTSAAPTAPVKPAAPAKSTGPTAPTKSTAPVKSAAPAASPVPTSPVAPAMPAGSAPPVPAQRQLPAELYEAPAISAAAPAPAVPAPRSAAAPPAHPRPVPSPAGPASAPGAPAAPAAPPAVVEWSDVAVSSADD